MVILNNSNENQTINTARFKENIKNTTQGLDIINNTIYTITKEITIQPKTALILELK